MSENSDEQMTEQAITEWARARKLDPPKVWPFRTGREMPNTGFFPKGGMCRTCVKLDSNCSKLPFHEMPAIETLDSGAKIVRCTEHARVGE